MQRNTITIKCVRAFELERKIDIGPSLLRSLDGGVFQVYLDVEKH